MSQKIILMRLNFLLIFIGASLNISAQVSTEQVEFSSSWLPESFVELDDGEWSRSSEANKIKKWDLNRISRDELMAFGKLTLWQVDQFFTYKKVMGDFKDVYELQAIPGWDPVLARSFVPFFKIESFPIKGWLA